MNLKVAWHLKILNHYQRLWKRVSLQTSTTTTKIKTFWQSDPLPEPPKMCHSIYSLTEHRLVDAILICESYHLQCNELSKSMRNRLDEISTIDAREWVIYPKQLAHTMVLNWLQYRYYTSYKARTPTLLQENACFGLDHKSCLIQFPYRLTKSIESRSIVEWFSSHARSPWINGRVSLNTDTTCWAAANLTQFFVSSSNLYTDTNRYRISRPI